MEQLRLIGVHEDGEHLLLADPEGRRLRLPIDDSVRSAVRRGRPAPGAGAERGETVRPREVQALIRAGATAEEVAEQTGWPLDRVARYEGPVLAEREHVAGIAQQVRLRGRTGHGTETLGSRVADRLAARDVDPGQVGWDAARSEDGVWRATVTFAAGGRRRSATWEVDVASRTVLPRDDEARWLAEEDDGGGPVPRPHPIGSGRSSTVFDVEAEGGLTEPAPRRREAAAGDAPVDLMSAIREHSSVRGRRRGGRRRDVAHTPVEEEPRLDALPIEDLAGEPGTPPPAAGPHPFDEEDAPTGGGEGDEAPGSPGAGSGLAGDELAGSAEPAESAENPESGPAAEAATAAQPDVSDVVPAAEPEGATIPDLPGEDADATDPPRGDAADATDPPEGDAAASDLPREHADADPPGGDTAVPVPPAEAAGTTGDPRPTRTADGADGAETTEATTDETTEATTDDAADEPTDPAAGRSRRGGSRRRGRTSVPSWDEVMFGGRR